MEFEHYCFRNFGVAEEILTRALTIAEKHFGVLPFLLLDGREIFLCLCMYVSHCFIDIV